jgi:hypothetical protein
MVAHSLSTTEGGRCEDMKRPHGKSASYAGECRSPTVERIANDSSEYRKRRWTKDRLTNCKIQREG